MNKFNQFLKEVEYAYNNVPFYNKLLSGLNISPTDIKTEADITKLPFTQKVDYRKNFPKGVLAEGFQLNHPMLTSSRSSGSTGERLITVEIGMNLLQRAMTCAVIHPSISKAFSKSRRKIARYAAPNCSDVECANPNSGIDDRLLADGTLVLPVYHDFLTTSAAMIDRAISEVEDYSPDLFYVDPTHFAFLLREYKKRNITPPKIPCITSYTGATGISKRQISEFYPMSTHYGELLSSTEFGWIAMQCPHGNMHLNDNSFFFEFIEIENSPEAETDYSELCISSIDQGVMPHLRYKTGDIVTPIEGKCSCGHEGKMILMQGRVSNFITNGGLPRLSPQQVDQLLGDSAWLDQYQLEQKSDDEFYFKMIVNELYTTGCENNFTQKLEQTLHSDVNVKISIVDYIAAERTGKFQSVKGLVKNV